MKSIYFFVASALLGFASCTTETPDHKIAKAFDWSYAPTTDSFAQFVNPMIGTDGHGHTFPGPSAPFGMVQLGPDTRLEGWDGCSGYHNSDSLIYGFSHTHLSGTGCSDYGDILVVPESGEAVFNNGVDGKPGYRSHFYKKDEKAEAGYYAVKLHQAAVNVELTASPRVGVHKYTFENNQNHALLFDLEHRDEVLDAYIEYVDANTIRGYRWSKAWATDQRIWFYATFSKPIQQKKFWNAELVKDSLHLHGKKLKLWLDFGSEKVVEVKVALSPVSFENAKLNMWNEVPDWNFERVRKKVREHWNSELSKIAVRSGDETKKRVFYSALYHCFLAPNVYSDVNGDYRGRDNAVHRDSIHPHYTVFSLWDTYRALHPLFTLVQQERTNDFITTFIDQHKQGGRLPVWELSANETECMIGYHAVPVIADAWLKGITNYDTAAAFQAMLTSASLDRLGLKSFKQCGFVAAEGEAESVSKTLEYAYDDWCIAQCAGRMNNEKEKQNYIQRSQNWRNLFDPTTKFFRARNNNSFVEPFAPEEVNFHFTEANAWQYSLYAPQDVSGLIAAHGGDANFTARLDQLFSVSSQTSGREQADITGLIGQYAHGNEPSHHVAYLYTYAGQPWKTADRVSEICTKFYTNAPDGLCGNEDCGQMSAWYVMSALGFYPVCPGTNEYAIGMPQFEEIELRLENGKKVTIKTNQRHATGMHITAASWNNQNWPNAFITHAALMQGGILNFTLVPVATPDWGTALSNRPHTYLLEDLRYPLTPRIANTSARTFTTELKIELAADAGAKIIYSLNGKPWEAYTQPLVLREPSRLQTYAVFENGLSSDTAFSEFYKSPGWKSVVYESPYAQQYAAGGSIGLIDGIQGGADYRAGTWQGFEGENFAATVDLGTTKKLEAVRINFFQDENSWIFMPDSVVFFISMDGKKFTRIGKQINDVPKLKTGAIQKLFFAAAQGQQARYVQVIGYTLGKCPPNHKGANGKSWLFTDEIQIMPQQ